MRRAQAAMEFITTYGWAIMVVLVMIGAISYFGVLNPNKLLPSRCVSAAEFSCQDYTIQSDTVHLRLLQSIGKTIYFTDATCTYNGVTAAASASIVGGSALGSGDSWSPRDTVELTCQFSDLPTLAGNKVKIYYSLTYQQSPTGFTQIAEGELFTEVQ